MGLIEVHTSGGFGYHPFAAGIGEAFSFAEEVLPAQTAVQVVTELRGRHCISLQPETLLGERNGYLAISDHTRRPVVKIRERWSSHRFSVREDEARREEQHHNALLRRYADPLLDTAADGPGAILARVVDGGGYGVMCLRLHGVGKASASAPPGDQFVAVWQGYGLPPLLPFRVDGSVPPLPVDLRARLSRV
ncbi:hypothetical protein ACIRYZ_42065 [Kitasatospora sp. NPDC101155]|uniref:hypothetical protein n=1 Tax=Kitasatospora sp. NPDC101155 TaxID=3364097 RepID=UPI00380245C2